MKAIRIHKYGGPEELKYEDAPTPMPAKDEVLIKVHASGVNPIDWKIRAGMAKEMYPVSFPLIPGWDVSGEVAEVGSDILNFKKGDEVYGRPSLSGNGSYAEYVVMKADELNAKPKSIDHDKSAGVPLAGQTAWQALFTHGNLKRGQRILIHGGSGGVGTYAVQFAKWKGAYVIATSSRDGIDLIYDLGADEVLDYHQEDFEKELDKVDFVLDLVGGETQKKSLEVIKDGGTLVTTVAPKYQKEAEEKNIEMKAFMAESIPADLQQIAELIDSGKVRPVIAKVFALEDAEKAQIYSEDGHPRGKVVLKVV